MKCAVLLIGLVFTAGACGRSSENPSLTTRSSATPIIATTELPQLFANSDAGKFADAELSAQKIERAADRSIVVTAAARSEREDVGFRVVLLPQWDTWKPQGFPDTLFRGAVRIEATGTTTETFVRALARAYGQKFEHYDFTQVKLTAIALSGDPTKVESVPVKLKLFFETGKGDEYAEVFLNFDLPHRVVQFHEKDQDYRKAVIGFLTKQSG